MFVGMVIGAGFATGRELALYFGGASHFTLILTGVIMGLVFGIFLYIGNSGSYQYLKNTHIGRLMSRIMEVSVILSFVVMVSGAEELLRDVLGVRYLGVMTGILVGILATFSMHRIKGISTLLVPFIVLLVICITWGGGELSAGHHSLLLPMRYVGMNMLMGGYFVLEDGERVSHRDIFISSTVVAVIFSTLLILIMDGIGAYSTHSMPIYILAESKGMRLLGALLIYFAILTTIMGNAKLIYDNMRALTSYRIVGVLFIVILSIISSIVDYHHAVDIIYTIEGIIGVIFVFFVVIGDLVHRGIFDRIPHH